MENRFTVKDFILVSLMSVITVLVVLAMWQVDRQWGELRSIKDRMEEQSASQRTQAEDLRKMRQRLDRGGFATAGAPTTQESAVQAADDADPFYRLRELQERPDFATGDWLVSALGGKIATLTPLVSGDVYASDVQNLVLESLATRDTETLDWKPWIATRWQIEDTSADFKKYVEAEKAKGRNYDDIIRDPKSPTPLKIVFNLRKGVTFSDGHPLTADDVVFTFEFTMNEKIAAPRARAYMQNIAKVEKVNDYEVAFIFREPYFEAFSLAGSMSILPKHFYEKYKPEDFNQSVGLLMGSGPYRLASPADWTPAQPVELIRNDRYWGVAPAVNKIVYRLIDTEPARLTAFKNGEVDSYASPPEAYKLLCNDSSMKEHAKNFEFYSVSGGYGYVAWNQVKDNTPSMFADKRVRQAMAMLIDRERALQEIRLGYGKLASGPFSPLSKQFDPNIKPLPFDVSRALQLLAEAGYVDRNHDGVLEDAAGKPMSFKLTYPTGRPTTDRLILFLKDAYAKAGVVMEPDPQEWAVFKERLGQKNFEAITLGWSAGVETDIFQMFHSSQTMAGGDNFMSYKNPELDKLIEEARMTIDESKRMVLWKKCHAIMNDDQPYMFLWFGKSLLFVDKRFQNVRPIATGLTPSSEWYVPVKDQRWKK